VKIFGREPALVISAIGAALMVLFAFHAPFVNAGTSDAVVAVLTAVLVAVTTRPVAPALFKGVLTAGVALLADYGLHFSDAQVGTLSAAVLAITALFVRSQVVPTTPSGNAV
jgi:hypothetical protein